MQFYCPIRICSGLRIDFIIWAKFEVVSSENAKISVSADTEHGSEQIIYNPSQSLGAITNSYSHAFVTAFSTPQIQFLLTNNLLTRFRTAESELE